MKFRDLRADEVDCRVSTVSDKGISLLLYKDARCDMRILDENNLKWQRKHYECKGNLFCSVGIYDEELKEWIWKDDCGTESYTEKEKGESSDSFKRACFNWGIGRELYTAPFIWIPTKDKDGKDNYTVSEKNGKATTNDRFAVTYMRTENGKIVALNIENPKKRKTVYVFGNIFPDQPTCCVCGKTVTADFAEKSKAANGGKVYCSKICKEK